MTPHYLTDLGSDEASAVYNDLVNAGKKLIDDPTDYDAAHQVATSMVPVSSYDTAADLGKYIQQKTLEWGLKLDMSGNGALGTTAGFLMYFAGNFIGDTIQIGAGTGQAVVDFEEGHYGRALLGILADIGRGAIMEDAFAKITVKASPLLGATASLKNVSLINRAQNALTNLLFKVGGKVIKYSGGEIALKSIGNKIVLSKGALTDVKAAFLEGKISATDVEKIGVSRTAEEVNDALRNVSQNPTTFNSPYQSGTQAIERVTATTEDYVRLITKDGDIFVTNPKGKWLVKKSDIQGLTSEQIRDKFALPNMPTHWLEVHVPAAVKIREGVAGAIEGWGKGGSTQYELLENIDGFDLSSLKSIGE